MDYFKKETLKINAFHQLRFEALWDREPYLRLNLFKDTALKWDIKQDASLEEIGRILSKNGIKYEFVIYN